MFYLDASWFSELQFNKGHFERCLSQNTSKCMHGCIYPTWWWHDYDKKQKKLKQNQKKVWRLAAYARASMKIAGELYCTGAVPQGGRGAAAPYHLQKNKEEEKKKEKEKKEKEMEEEKKRKEKKEENENEKSSWNP